MIIQQEDRNLYRRMHRKVRKLRGPARDHECVSCGNQAYFWAQIHTETGLDPWADYVPLCGKCHQRYDDVHEKQSAALRGRPKTAEHKAKIGAGNKGKTRSAEARERLRAVALSRKNSRGPDGRFLP